MLKVITYLDVDNVVGGECNCFNREGDRLLIGSNSGRLIPYGECKESCCRMGAITFQWDSSSMEACPGHSVSEVSGQDCCTVL